MNRNELLGIASDLFKDCNGCRPSYAMLDRMSDIELVHYLNGLQAQIEWQMEAERECELMKWDEFEGAVDNAIEMGAGDRATALRWLYEAEGADDPGHFVWRMGLLHSPHADRLIEELNEVL